MMSIRALVFLLIGSLVTTAAAAEPMPLDIFSVSGQPPDAWKPSGQTEPARPARLGAHAATEFICPFAKLPIRGSWDYTGKFDLSAASRFRFEVRTDHPDHIRRATLYFRSGAGWYAGAFQLNQSGTTTVELRKADFTIEDKPAGWHAIDGVRISFWKRDGVTQTARFTVGQLVAYSDAIVVVRGNRTILKGSSKGRDVQKYAAAAAALLGELTPGVGILNDTDVEAGGLRGASVAVFPYNPDLTLREVEAIKRFVAGGGRIIVFYSLPKALAEVLGITEVEWKRSRNGMFTSVHFDVDALPGVPHSFIQNSGNARMPNALAADTRVIAWWHDGDGKRTQTPAVTMNAAGAFMGHVLMPGDRERKIQMLLALLASFDDAMIDQAMKQSVRFAGFEDTADLGRYIDQQSRTVPRERIELARKLLDTSGRVIDQPGRQAALEADGSADAFKATHGRIVTVFRVREALRRAYFLSLASRPGEFRGVWCHSALGLKDQTWEQTIASLARDGFDVILPNMLWGGQAYYPSNVLPVARDVERHGDQLAQCLEAAAQHGVAVHVWKVNWNLINAPDDFMEMLRSEWRLQQDRAGREQAWLCPSHPDNFQLELDSILEVITRYPVDGFHFDYIRYPSSRTCYCDGCLTRFAQAEGVTIEDWPDAVITGAHAKAYRKWRAAQITRLVAAVSEQARRVRPGIKISAAVFTEYPECRESVGQDWLHWVEQGYLDFLCPMNYTTSNDQFTQWTREQLRLVDGRIPVYPGIGVSVKEGMSAVEAAEQLMIARQIGAPGYVVFEYKSDAAARVLPALRHGLTAP